MNNFGGNWTEDKIDILVDYAKEYLKIMNTNAKKYGWKLLYFDGFAGSGLIMKETQEARKVIIGATKRILEIDYPRSFDAYYFVEKDSKTCKELEENTKNVYKNKKIYVAHSDCNEKLIRMGEYLLSKGKEYKALAYIDPYGMQLNWSSIEAVSKQSVDMWILIPTGIGLNRLLKKNGQISDGWSERLEKFLGLSREKIIDYFYNVKRENTLFGIEEKMQKEEQAIEKAAVLYRERLAELYEFVSEPYVLRNSSNAIMFHFLMVSNNKTAHRIANHIVKKYSRHGTIKD